MLKGHLTADAVFFGKLCKLIRLRRRNAKRLVAVNMLAGKDCRLCLRIVKRIGRANIDDVYFGIGYYAVKVADCI